MKGRRFIVCSEDCSGVGFARKMQDEGEDVIFCYEPSKDDEDAKDGRQVGKGYIELMPLADAVRIFSRGSDANYFIFDTNHLSDTSEKLRAGGARVFGASALSAQLEYDRAFAVQTAQQAGLWIPETKEFKTLEQGTAFLEQHQDEAFVMKVNGTDASHLSFVPDRESDDEANEELVRYMRHMDLSGSGAASFILQQRRKGVDNVNFELWLSEGEPVFAFATLESKRRLDRDLGPHCGCSGDVVFTVPMDCRGVRDTVGKLVPFLRSKKYTGFVDTNVILSDHEAWFLETGCRFGYNSHPNLFLTLALDGMGDILADLIDGKTGQMAERFRHGFGASISVYLEHPRPGLPLHLSDRFASSWYGYDTYQEDGDLLLAGYSHDLGLMTAHDFTIEGAFQEAFERLFVKEAVSVPDLGYRTDLATRAWPGAPIRRYEALASMHLFEKS